MMQTLLVAVCLLASARAACPPGSCMTVRCMQMTQAQCGAREHFDAQGGVCGCCPACVPYKGES